MKVFDSIRHFVSSRARVLRDFGFIGSQLNIGCEPFGDVVFRNIVELLTDLCNDVTWIPKGNYDAMRVAEFVRFFNEDGQTALYRVFKDGYVVVGVFDSEHGGTIRLLDCNEWTEVTKGNLSVVTSRIEGCDAVVMRSSIFRADGISDYCALKPFVDFLDSTLNASTTMVKRLGAMVVASPENQSGAPTVARLSEEDKKDIEEKMAKDYGAMSSQRQIMLLPRQMRMEVISLVNLDARLNERVRLAVLAICDRVKVPANQVSIIDANSSKALSNGSELREGDFNKYQSFERLLNKTFVKLASDLGMTLTYDIYNKPQRGTTQDQ